MPQAYPEIEFQVLWLSRFVSYKMWLIQQVLAPNRDGMRTAKKHFKHTYLVSLMQDLYVSRSTPLLTLQSCSMFSRLPFIALTKHKHNRISYGIMEKVWLKLHSRNVCIRFGTQEAESRLCHTARAVAAHEFVGVHNSNSAVPLLDHMNSALQKRL